MGSESDRETLQPAADMLKKLGISYDWRVISAHRAPEYLHKYIKQSTENGTQVFIAGAGGAAHLPGVIASFTTRPVIGIPVHTSKLNGLDSLLSIVNMPGGVPVATMAIGTAGAKNAGIFAASILGVRYNEIENNVKNLREEQRVLLEDSAEKSAESFQP